MPSIFSYAKTDEQRALMRFAFASTEFGRPYAFPPDVPQDRVAIMRKAMADAARDPRLLAEAGRAKLDMTYTPPEMLERLVAELYETPPALVATIKSICRARNSSRLIQPPEFPRWRPKWKKGRR